MGVKGFDAVAWQGLFAPKGTPAEIATVEKQYRVYAKKTPLASGGYGMDHSSVIYLMGADGRLVTFYDELISPDALEKDLKAKI